MEFEDAATFFDQTAVADGYTSAALFEGRTSSHDDHSSSGATSRRRTLTADPSNIAPARGVVLVQGDHWLIGSSNVDHFLGAPIRINFDLKKTTDLADALTPGEACLGAAGTPLYLRREWYRDQTDTMTSADYYTMWNVFYTRTEPVAKGSFFRMADGTLLRARNDYEAQERLNIAEADELDATARQAARCTTTGAVDIASDSVETDIIDTFILSLDASKFFRFAAKDDADYKPGDRIFFVAQSAVPLAKVGMQVRVNSQNWLVRQVSAEQDAWAMRVRRA